MKPLTLEALIKEIARRISPEMPAIMEEPTRKVLKTFIAIEREDLKKNGQDDSQSPIACISRRINRGKS